MSLDKARHILNVQAWGIWDVEDEVKQKVSGTFRTQIGAQRFARIRGHISTVKKHRRNVLNAIQDALMEKPFQPEWNFSTK